MKKCFITLLFLAVFFSHVIRTATSSTALFDAARKGDCAAVSKLLGDGVDVDARDDLGDTALMTAAAFAPLDCVRALVDGGAAVNASSTGGSARGLAPGKRGESPSDSGRIICIAGSSGQISRC